MKWSFLSHMQSFMAWNEGCTGPLIEVLLDVTVETRLVPPTKIRVFLGRGSKMFCSQKATKSTCKMDVSVPFLSMPLCVCESHED